MICLIIFLFNWRLYIIWHRRLICHRPWRETAADSLRQSRWRLATTFTGDKLTLKLRDTDGNKEKTKKPRAMRGFFEMADESVRPCSFAAGE